MDIYQRYSKVKLLQDKLAVEEKELREQIKVKIEKNGESIITPYGKFIMMTTRVFTYSENLQKELAKREEEIASIKEEMKQLKERAKVLGKVTEEDPIINFKFSTK